MLCLLFCGCAAKMVAPSSEDVSVILMPGDEIEIKFASAEQFNEIQIIRPDGKIELQYIGEVTAAGRTPSSLRDELIKQLSAHLKYPQLAVFVRSMRGRRVYVGGEVMRTGFIDMPGAMSALEAIMEVGGFREETANIKNIILVRHKGGKRYSYKFSIADALEGKGEESKIVYLEPRDILIVPQKTIINVNQWVKHYITDNLPITPSMNTFVAPQAAQ